MSNIEQLKEAASLLQDRHYKWIIDAALRHFQNKIAELELEIVRHEHFHDARFYDFMTLNGTREDKINDAKRYLEEYRDIVLFLRILSDVVTTFSAKKFAEDVYVMLHKKDNK